MSEIAKTLTFVGAAIAAVLIAWGTAPSAAKRNTSNETGTLLVEDFDPLTVGSLEITTYDEATGESQSFLVAKADVKGKTRWSIPSHDNYPTDAKDQFGEVVGNLTGLKILGMVAEGPARFAEFGVIDPKECKPGETGVGKRIILKDQQDKNLAALIIGKEVVDRPQNRYVRRVDDTGKGEDRVYEVAVKADKITPRFDAWIDKNLLGMNSWDIKSLAVRDYTVDLLGDRIRLHNNGELGFEYNDAGAPKWKLVRDEKMTFEKGSKEPQYVPRVMAENEELNQARLDEMKTALDDLKIVDVRRKPEGLSADLKASKDFENSQEAFASLASNGFYPLETPEGATEIFSNNGETRIDMKDGVQYVLRFGGAAVDSAAGSAEKGKEKPAGMNRYLFVMAEFSPEAIAKPELEVVPGEEKKAEEGDKPAEGEKAAEGKDAKAEANRQAIEKRNKQKTDEYAAKVKKGQERVGELNNRFSDWYYIISEDVYKKIHLTREEIVKKKEAPKEGDGHDHKEHADPEENPMGAFDAMKQEGLKP